MVLNALTKAEERALSQDLDAFVVLHGDRNRPIALVSSGGTAADLELHSVRCLENFSTGVRGATAVEGFLRRGYAVIHLWRQGSASPYARVLAQELGHPPHFGLDTEALSKLFPSTRTTNAGEAMNDMDNEEGEEESLREVLRKEDPWLTKNDIDGGTYQSSSMANAHASILFADTPTGHGHHLSRALQHSARLQKAMREFSTVQQERRLLTISFRTVEEYLTKLQMCATALQPCHSLALTYLAAAVSDFYIPRAERAEHKIQSSSSSSETIHNNNKNQNQNESSNAGGLTLHLKPVPKTIGRLRSEWAPSAFCVSFKLETDAAILREKAERAVQAYGVHLVVGNILETRYDTVWILGPDTQREAVPTSAQQWTMQKLSRPPQSSSSSSQHQDSLEEMILDKVVESHFEYISWRSTAEDLEAARHAQEAWKEKRQRVERDLYWKRVQALGTEVIGYVLSGVLSWAVALALQRLRRSLD